MVTFGAGVGATTLTLGAGAADGTTLVTVGAGGGVGITTFWIAVGAGAGVGTTFAGTVAVTTGATGAAAGTSRMIVFSRMTVVCCGWLLPLFAIIAPTARPASAALVELSCCTITGAGAGC